MNAEEYASATKKFQPENLTLAVSPHWRVLLRVKQITLGSLVLLPLEPIEDFGSADAEEPADLFGTISKCQAALGSVFAPDRYNLIAAMMKDPFVHFHLIPRYQSERSFAGQKWTDSEWPQLISFRDVQTDEATLGAVFAALASAMSAQVAGH
jgi:diadenosine tetraphosphate (Ap4A) HIT family hydrolase